MHNQLGLVCYLYPDQKFSKSLFSLHVSSRAQTQLLRRGCADFRNHSSGNFAGLGRSATYAHGASSRNAPSKKAARDAGLYTASARDTHLLVQNAFYVWRRELAKGNLFPLYGDGQAVEKDTRSKKRAIHSFRKNPRGR